MNIKPVVKYYTKFYIECILKYFLIYIATVLLLLILDKLGIIRGNVNGTEFVSAIFVFVMGLNSFKGQFKFLSQNGISRKTITVGFMISALAVVIVALVDDIFIGLMTYTRLYKGSLYESLFGGTENGIMYYFKSFVFLFSLEMGLIALGRFISAIYYRLSGKMKAIFTIGMVVLINMLVAGIGPICTVNEPMKIIFKGLIGYLGFTTNPFIPALVYLIYFFIFTYLTHLLMKNAVVKE